MSDLKPCPVCEGSASICTEHDPDMMKWYYVKCGKCGLRTRGKWCSEPCHILMSEVRDEWNTRPTPDKQAEKLAEALRLLKIAECPANCDGGIIPEQIAEDEWQPVQCQFCHEREQALSDYEESKG